MQLSHCSQSCSQNNSLKFFYTNAAQPPQHLRYYRLTWTPPSLLLFIGCDYFYPNETASLRSLSYYRATRFHYVFKIFAFCEKYLTVIRL